MSEETIYTANPGKQLIRTVTGREVPPGQSAAWTISAFPSRPT